MLIGHRGGMDGGNGEYGIHWLVRTLARLLSTLDASQTSSLHAIWLRDRTILPLSSHFYHSSRGVWEYNYNVITVVTTLQQLNLYSWAIDDLCMPTHLIYYSHTFSWQYKPWQKRQNSTCYTLYFLKWGCKQQSFYFAINMNCIFLIINLFYKNSKIGHFRFPQANDMYSNVLFYC